MTTSVIKQVNDTANNVLTTVGTLANQVTRTVNTAGEGLDMLNSFVTKAREKQKANNVIEMDQFYLDLAREASINIARAEVETARVLNSDPEIKKIFLEHHSRYTTLLNKLQNPEAE